MGLAFGEVPGQARDSVGLEVGCPGLDPGPPCLDRSTKQPMTALARR